MALNFITPYPEVQSGFLIAVTVVIVACGILRAINKANSRN
jgi:hypothetical protein